MVSSSDVPLLQKTFIDFPLHYVQKTKPHGLSNFILRYLKPATLVSNVLLVLQDLSSGCSGHVEATSVLFSLESPEKRHNLHFGCRQRVFLRVG